MSSSSPWDVTASLDVSGGFSLTMCIECTNGDITVTKDDWEVELVDCTNVLSVPTAPTTIKQYATNPAKIYGNDWDSAFGNTDVTNCAITSCSLYDNDCSTPLSSSDIYFSGSLSSGDLFVYAKRNVEAGYSLTICVVCSNGDQDIQLNNWSVSQTEA